MSLPRLPFLYPLLLRQLRLRPPLLIQHRSRHGTAVEPPPSDPPTPPPASPPESTDPKPKPKPPTPSPPNDTAPQTSAPSTLKDDKSKAPSGSANPAETPEHTATPNYIHNFDTYTTVQRLEENGKFTREQSVTLMKAVRGLLATNLEDAQERLVSRSYIENSSYLFHTACSELRNEMQNAKRANLDQLRAERTRIQTEYDLLNQAFLAEMMVLKDELNSMFNDRKMVTRAEARAMENKIQELNYKITILMNSEMKSEIEKLRWITTRRGLMAIASLAFVVVMSIRLQARSDARTKKEEKAKEKKEYEEHEHRQEAKNNGHVEYGHSAPGRPVDSPAAPSAA